MKHLFNWKKTLAALCVLALLVSMLAGAALAEEMVEIPESDYIYVNGDSKIVTAAGELSVLLRLTVENPSRIHILSSGVDVSMVLFDEGAGDVVGVYSSQNGLMDVPFNANPGSYLIGLTGEGEVELLVADENRTGEIYSAEEVVTVSADEASEPSTEAALGEEENEVQPATEESAPAAPSYDPAVPVRYRAELNETISVLDVLRAAGAKVEAVTYVSGNIEGRVFSSASSILGDWLLTPYMPFDSIELSVRTFEDVTYTLILSCPAPEAEPVEAPAAEAVEAPAEEIAAEEPVEAPAVEAVEAPAEEVEAEEPIEAPIEETVDTAAEVPAEEAVEAEAEEPAEATAEQPEENGENKKGFLSGFVDFLFGSKKEATDETAQEASDEAVDETEENAADEAEPTEESADEAEPADEAEVADEEAESTEEPAEAPVEEAPVFDPTAPISRQVTSNETLSLLTALADAEVPANVITNVTGELEGRAIMNQNNGDWLITPYAYFDELTLTVTATDYLAEDPAAAEADYTLILTNPDPDAKDDETAEPAEETAEEAPAPEVLPAKEVTIAAERGEDNAIRLFAENISEEEKDTFTYQWQYSLDNEEWLDVEGANDKDYNFQMDETNGLYYWRLIVSYK